MTDSQLHEGFYSLSMTTNDLNVHVINGGQSTVYLYTRKDAFSC